MESLLNRAVVYESGGQQADWLESQGFSAAVAPDGYWTSTTYAGGDTNAFIVWLSVAHFQVTGKTTALRCLLVRGASDVLPQTGQATSYSATGGEDGDVQAGVPWPDPRFTNNGDNTVTDNLTGLVWEQSVSNSALTLSDALADAESFADGGFNDWRLPTVRELATLVNFGAAAPVTWLNSSGFSNVNLMYFWTATRNMTNPATTGLALYTDAPQTGGITAANASAAAWPVRGGE